MNVFPIDVPPLRERPGDVLLCARYFLEKYARQIKKPITDVSREAADRLTGYEWPGNIRELKNAIERAVVVSHESEIQVEDLPLHIVGNKRPRPGDDTLDSIERVHIAYILQRENWNITHAAKVLGIDRVTLYNRIKKYGLSK